MSSPAARTDCFHPRPRGAQILTAFRTVRRLSRKTRAPVPHARIRWLPFGRAGSSLRSVLDQTANPLESDDLSDEQVVRPTA